MIQKTADDYLIDWLAHESEVARELAALAMLELQNKNAIPRLIEMLNDSSEVARRYAYQALIAFGKKALKGLAGNLLNLNYEYDETMISFILFVIYKIDSKYFEEFSDLKYALQPIKSFQHLMNLIDFKIYKLSNRFDQKMVDFIAIKILKDNCIE